MKVKTWPKEELRRRERAFIKRALPQLAALVAVGAAAGALIWIMWDGQPRAFVLGAGTVGLVWAIWTVVALGSGSINQRFGFWGEDATRSEIKKMRWRGWRLVQGLTKLNGDIDGVAVGPAGVFVIETKWRNDSPNDGHMLSTRSQYAKQATTNASVIQYFLRAEGVDVAVQPIAVLWGPGTKSLPLTEGLHDGVAIVHGLDLRSWLRSHPVVLDRSARRSIGRKLIERASEDRPL